MCSELCDPQPMTCYLWPVTHARPAPQITSWFAECICLLLSDSAGQNVSVWMRPRQRWIINLVNNAWGEVRVGKVQIKSTLNAHLTYRRRTAKSINVWKTPRFVGRIPSPPNGSSSNKLCCAFMCVCVCVCVCIGAKMWEFALKIWTKSMLIYACCRRWVYEMLAVLPRLLTLVGWRKSALCCANRLFSVWWKRKKKNTKFQCCVNKGWTLPTRNSAQRKPFIAQFLNFFLSVSFLSFFFVFCFLFLFACVQIVLVLIDSKNQNTLNCIPQLFIVKICWKCATEYWMY